MKKKNKYLLSVLLALGAFPVVQAQQTNSEVTKTESSDKVEKKVDEIVLKQGDKDEEILFVQEEKVEPKFTESFSFALQTKAYAKIDEFLKKGANINQVIYDGNTIAQISAFHRDLDLLEFLSERKANLANLNKNDESILYWGAAGKSAQYLEEAKFFLGKNFDTLMAKKTKTGRTPLHAAVLYEGNINVINWLIANKVDIRAKDVNGQTAMHYAAALRKWDVLEALLRKGGSLSEVDNDGESVESYLFSRMDFLTIDRFHPYVSPEKKEYIESIVVKPFPDKALLLNPKINLTDKQKELLETRKEVFIDGKEVIK
jgi:hypothetical protein